MMLLNVVPFSVNESANHNIVNGKNISSASTNASTSNIINTSNNNNTNVTTKLKATIIDSHLPSINNIVDSITKRSRTRIIRPITTTTSAITTKTTITTTTIIARIFNDEEENVPENDTTFNTVIQGTIGTSTPHILIESTRRTMTAIAGNVAHDSDNTSNNNDASSNWETNGTVRSINTAVWSIEQCMIWHRPHHLYFQLGNAFLLLAFLAPHGLYGALWLRTMLIGASILLGMYGYLIDCAQDFIVWSGLFFVVNFIYFFVILCRLRPVRFDKEIEAVYITLFKPLRVTRHQFRKVLNCMKLIRALKYQEVYAQEKVTKVDSLSLVLSGKLVVSQNQRALHIVFPHQFLDSPEWFGVSTDDYFQVSILAMEESRVLIWHRDKLKLSIMAEPFLQTVFDHILGRDVVKKLMQVTQVNESIASNGFLPSGGYDDGEDKPMLVMKKSIDGGHSLTALINRQLQEEHVPLLLGRTYTARTTTTTKIKSNNNKLFVQPINGQMITNSLTNSTMTVNKLISCYNENINEDHDNVNDNEKNSNNDICNDGVDAVANVIATADSINQLTLPF